MNSIILEKSTMALLSPDRGSKSSSASRSGSRQIKRLQFGYSATPEWAGYAIFSTMLDTYVLNALQTVLSDQMADRISSLEGLSSPLVLRIYLEYDKRALQTVDHCLRHLLRQVISHPLAPQVSEDLRRCYEIANSSAKPPTTEELMMLLALELTPFENTWIVLDGLEEVKGSVAQNLLRHFKAMITDMSEVNLRLAVFSRTSNEDKDVYGSEKVFCNSTKDHRYVLTYFLCLYTYS